MMITFYRQNGSSHSPEPPPKTILVIYCKRGEHVFTPNGFILEQVCVAIYVYAVMCGALELSIIYI